MKATASKGLVDADRSYWYENTVKAARALGMSDENTLKKTAKIASKSAQSGGKTRKEEEKKTRNKNCKRNKS